jgi:hypothetical protein
VVTYMQNKVQKNNEEMALLKEENERLKRLLVLEESKNWQHAMESQLKKSKGQVYSIEAELILAKFAKDDLKEEGVRMATENERLKQEQVTITIEDAMRRAAVRRKLALKEEKEHKRRTMRYVLAAFKWTKETADPVLLVVRGSMRVLGCSWCPYRRKNHVKRLEWRHGKTTGNGVYV